jgi:hypothetical protein
MTVPKPFIYDKHGNCVNCGGEGWITFKCYDNWKLRYGWDEPKCDALYVVHGAVIAGALAVGWTGVGTAASLGAAVFGLREMYLADCVKFGYNGEEDCESDLYKFANWYTSLVADDDWYKQETLATGRALPNDAPEYTEKSHPEDWRTDVFLRFQALRDSSDLPISDYYIRLIIDNPQFREQYHNGYIRKDYLDKILRMLANESPDIHYSRLKNNPVDLEKSAPEKYQEGDLDQDIGKGNLSDDARFDASSTNEKINAVNEFKNR